jgi:MSHA biogenesis protein MshO
MLLPLRHSMSNLRPKFEQGFTLVEAVIAIVITGIIGGIVALFIRLPVRGYVDSEARAELTDVADTTLRRMARDLRLALPNSIRRTAVGTGANQIVYLEFLLTKTGGRYLAEEDHPNSGNILSFADSSSTTFNVVGPMPVESQQIVKDDYIVVYNLGPGFAPADAYTCEAASIGCNRAKVDVVDQAGSAITMYENRFAQQPDPKLTSPGHRFHVVSSPVTYVCDPVAGTLTRYWGYEIQATQPADVSVAPFTTAPNTTAPHGLLATRISACEFSYDNPADSMVSQRSGLVGLSLTMKMPNGESITLFHQVHADNTP